MRLLACVTSNSTSMQPLTKLDRFPNCNAPPCRPQWSQLADRQAGISREKNMDWRCPSCAESVPTTFDMCWNCGRPEHNSGPSTTASNRASTEGANYKHPANIRALRRCFRCLLIFFSCAAVIDLLYHGITRFSILVGIQLLIAPLLSILFIYLFGTTTPESGTPCR